MGGKRAKIVKTRAKTDKSVKHWTKWSRRKGCIQAKITKTSQNNGGKEWANGTKTDKIGQSQPKVGQNRYIRALICQIGRNNPKQEKPDKNRPKCPKTGKNKWGKERAKRDKTNKLGQSQLGPEYLKMYLPNRSKPDDMGQSLPKWPKVGENSHKVKKQVKMGVNW